MLGKYLILLNNSNSFPSAWQRKLYFMFNIWKLGWQLAGIYRLVIVTTNWCMNDEIITRLAPWRFTKTSKRSLSMITMAGESCVKRIAYWVTWITFHWVCVICNFTILYRLAIIRCVIIVVESCNKNDENDDTWRVTC